MQSAAQLSDEPLLLHSALPPSAASRARSAARRFILASSPPPVSIGVAEASSSVGAQDAFFQSKRDAQKEKRAQAEEAQRSMIARQQERWRLESAATTAAASTAAKRAAPGLTPEDAAALAAESRGAYHRAAGWVLSEASWAERHEIHTPLDEALRSDTAASALRLTCDHRAIPDPKQLPLETQRTLQAAAARATDPSVLEAVRKIRGEMISPPAKARPGSSTAARPDSLASTLRPAKLSIEEKEAWQLPSRTVGGMADMVAEDLRQRHSTKPVDDRAAALLRPSTAPIRRPFPNDSPTPAASAAAPSSLAAKLDQMHAMLTARSRAAGSHGTSTAAASPTPAPTAAAPAFSSSRQPSPEVEAASPFTSYTSALSGPSRPASAALQPSSSSSAALTDTVLQSSHLVTDGVSLSDWLRLLGYSSVRLVHSQMLAYTRWLAAEDAEVGALLKAHEWSSLLESLELWPLSRLGSLFQRGLAATLAEYQLNAWQREEHLNSLQALDPLANRARASTNILQVNLRADLNAALDEAAMGNNRFRAKLFRHLHTIYALPGAPPTLDRMQGVLRSLAEQSAAFGSGSRPPSTAAAEAMAVAAGTKAGRHGRLLVKRQTKTNETLSLLRPESARTSAARNQKGDPASAAGSTGDAALFHRSLAASLASSTAASTAVSRAVSRPASAMPRASASPGAHHRGRSSNFSVRSFGSSSSRPQSAHNPFTKGSGQILNEAAVLAELQAAASNGKASPDSARATSSAAAPPPMPLSDLMSPARSGLLLHQLDTLSAHPELAVAFPSHMSAEGWHARQLEHMRDAIQSPRDHALHSHLRKQHDAELVRLKAAADSSKLSQRVVFTAAALDARTASLRGFAEGLAADRAASKNQLASERIERSIVFDQLEAEFNEAEAERLRNEEAGPGALPTRLEEERLFQQHFPAGLLSIMQPQEQQSEAASSTNAATHTRAPSSSHLLLKASRPSSAALAGSSSAAPSLSASLPSEAPQRSLPFSALSSTYPDVFPSFRSVEFRPERVLDPLLMSPSAPSATMAHVTSLELKPALRPWGLEGLAAVSRSGMDLPDEVGLRECFQEDFDLVTIETDLDLRPVAPPVEDAEYTARAPWLRAPRKKRALHSGLDFEMVTRLVMLRMRHEMTMESSLTGSGPHGGAQGRWRHQTRPRNTEELAAEVQAKLEARAAHFRSLGLDPTEHNESLRAAARQFGEAHQAWTKLQSTDEFDPSRPHVKGLWRGSSLLEHEDGESDEGSEDGAEEEDASSSSLGPWSSPRPVSLVEIVSRFHNQLHREGGEAAVGPHRQRSLKNKEAKQQDAYSSSSAHSVAPSAPRRLTPAEALALKSSLQSRLLHVWDSLRMTAHDMLAFLQRYTESTEALQGLDAALGQWEAIARMWTIREQRIEEVRTRVTQPVSSGANGQPRPTIIHASGGADDHSLLLAVSLQLAHAAWALFMTTGDLVCVAGEPLWLRLEQGVVLECCGVGRHVRSEIKELWGQVESMLAREQADQQEEEGRKENQNPAPASSLGSPRSSASGAKLKILAVSSPRATMQLAVLGSGFVPSVDAPPPPPSLQDHIRHYTPSSAAAGFAKPKPSLHPRPVVAGEFHALIRGASVVQLPNAAVHALLCQEDENKRMEALTKTQQQQQQPQPQQPPPTQPQSSKPPCPESAQHLAAADRPSTQRGVKQSSTRSRPSTAQIKTRTSAASSSAASSAALASQFQQRVNNKQWNLFY